MIKFILFLSFYMLNAYNAYNACFIKGSSIMCIKNIDFSNHTNEKIIRNFKDILKINNVSKSI